MGSWLRGASVQQLYQGRKEKVHWRPRYILSSAPHLLGDLGMKLKDAYSLEEKL